MEVVSDVLKPRQGYFDSSDISILDSFSISEGKLVIYSVNHPFAIGAALIDKQESSKIVWRCANPLGYSQASVYDVKIECFDRKLTLYLNFQKNNQQVIEVLLDELFGYHKKNSHSILERITANPIMKPIASQVWQGCSVYNTAALYLAEKVHFIYRALSHEGISVFGYAASPDGIHITERADKPIFAANSHQSRNEKYQHLEPFQYNSGGSWCGCEDPRLVEIDDRIYMTYTAYDGVHPPCICMTSISVNDFLQKKWRWSNSVQLSHFGQTHKNWVLFPEKIKYKYTLLHSITPRILIDSFDDLHFATMPNIQSYYHSRSDDIDWDNWLRGIGPPPIKIKEGWLLIYHATDTRKDPDKYKIGAMIVSENDPAKILFRTAQPLLQPMESYELNGLKPGVVYTCGAVVIADRLFLYYGAADTVICVASAKLADLLHQIKQSQPQFIN